MAISSSPIQQKINTPWSSGPSYSFTLDSNPIDGNVLVLYAVCITSGGTVTSVSQTGVTWTLVTRSIVTATRPNEIWKGVVRAGASTSVTVNLSFTPSAVNVSGEISEWSGIDLVASVDVTGGAGTTSTNPTSGTITPTAGKNALIIACMRGSNVPSGTPGSPFADLLSSDSGNRAFGTYQVVVSTSGTYTATWTAVSALWGSAYAVFNAAGSRMIGTSTLTGGGTKTG